MPAGMLLDPDGFLRSLGEFPSSMAGSLADALASLCNERVGWAIDTIAPRCQCPVAAPWSVPWFTAVLWTLK